MSPLIHLYYPSHLLYLPRLRFSLFPFSWRTFSTLLARVMARDDTWELRDPLGSGRPSLTEKQSRMDRDITKLDTCRERAGQRLKDRAEHAYVSARAKISYRKYFIVSIIQSRINFVIFNFLVLSDYENISATKISGFTVPPIMAGEGPECIQYSITNLLKRAYQSCGNCGCTVSYENQSAVLPLVAVKGEGPTLFGIGWRKSS